MFLSFFLVEKTMTFVSEHKTSDEQKKFIFYTYYVFEYLYTCWPEEQFTQKHHQSQRKIKSNEIFKSMKNHNRNKSTTYNI